MFAAVHQTAGQTRVEVIMNSHVGVESMKRGTYWILTLISAVLLSGCSEQSSAVRIVIPAGSEEEVVYSEEEISPRNHELKLSYDGEMQGVRVRLLVTECREENAYDEALYLAQGEEEKYDYVEKGAWFRIGVCMQNPTEEERVLYITAEDVDVRIQ